MTAPPPLRRKLRELALLAGDEPVPSPCNSVCRMHPVTGLCEGCLRTLDEIAAWGRLPEAGKRQVWAELARRAAAKETP